MMYIVLALFSGCLVIMSMAINAQLAKKVGIFKGTFVNYAVGLTTTMIIILFTNVPIMAHFKTLSAVPTWAYMGGVLGVIVVASSNVVITKVPTVYVTLLSFAGQLLAGMIIDYTLNGVISWQKLIGVLLIIAGLAYNSHVDRVEEEKEIQDAI